MSELKVDTLTGKTTANDITVTAGATATMSLEQGLAKAYIYSPATSASITDSFNIASITDGGTGEQDMAFVSSMSDANYSSIVAIQTVNMQNTGGSVRTVGVHSKTSSLIDARADYIISNGFYFGGYENVVFYNMSTHGDLA
jgi:hypothetical protein